nr:hypothetical protein [Saprospiraceae bacterium]
MHLKFILSFFLLFAISDNNLCSQEWARQVHLEGNFSVMLPNSPKLKVNEVVDPVFGELRLNHWTAVDTSAKTGEMVYTIFYTDYPEDMVHQDSTDLLEEFFAATAESAAYSMAGNLIYSSELGGFECPGYTFRIHYNLGDAVIRSRAYLCCSRLYILSVAGLTEGVSTDQLFKFFNSFRLINSCDVR